MGMMHIIWGALFGGGRNVVAETVEAFRPNAEASDQRAHARSLAAVKAAAEEGRGSGFVGGIKALVRPFFALSVLALFGFAMADPTAFAVRMAALAAVPEPLWIILGGIVAFYFGSREAEKIRGVRAGDVVAGLSAFRSARQSIEAQPSGADYVSAAAEGPNDLGGDNPALAEAREVMQGAKW